MHPSTAGDEQERIVALSKATTKGLIAAIVAADTFSEDDPMFIRLRRLGEIFDEGGAQNAGFLVRSDDNCMVRNFEDGKLGLGLQPLARANDMRNGLTCWEFKKSITGMLLEYLDQCGARRVTDKWNILTGQQMDFGTVVRWEPARVSYGRNYPGVAAVRGLAENLLAAGGFVQDWVIDPAIIAGSVAGQTPTYSLPWDTNGDRFNPSGAIVTLAPVRISYDVDRKVYSWNANSELGSSAGNVIVGSTSKAVGTSMMLGNVLASFRYERDGIVATMHPIAEAKKSYEPIPGSNKVTAVYRDFVFVERAMTHDAGGGTFPASLEEIMAAEKVDQTDRSLFGSLAFEVDYLLDSPRRDSFLAIYGLEEEDFPKNVAGFMFGR